MFRYELTAVVDEKDDNQVYPYKGIVKGNSIQEAVETICNWFGGDNIVSIDKLYEVDEILELKVDFEEAFD